MQPSVSSASAVASQPAVVCTKTSSTLCHMENFPIVDDQTVTLSSHTVNSHLQTISQNTASRKEVKTNNTSQAAAQKHNNMKQVKHTIPTQQIQSNNKGNWSVNFEAENATNSDLSPLMNSPSIEEGAVTLSRTGDFNSTFNVSSYQDLNCDMANSPVCKKRIDSGTVTKSQPIDDDKENGNERERGKRNVVRAMDFSSLPTGTSPGECVYLTLVILCL